MKKKIIFVFLVCSILIPFLFSCSFDEEEKKGVYSLRGAGCYYTEYPDWCSGLFVVGDGSAFGYDYKADIFDCYGFQAYMFCVGYSEWKDWQSEEGKKLHGYVPNNLISDYYEGKYRVILYGQDLMLGFNDNNGTIVNILYNWLGFKTGSNIILSAELTDDNKIEYDCNAINRLTDKKEKYNKSHVVISNLGNGKFSYNQTIWGKTIFNVELSKADYLTNVMKPSWYPKRIDGINGFDVFSADITKNLQIAPGNAILSMMDYDYPTYTTGNILSLEGFELREQDDANMTISFNYLDADSGGFADYVEVRRKDDDFVNITFYKDGKIVRQHKNLTCYDRW